MFDGFEEVALRTFAVFCNHGLGLGIRPVFDTLHHFEVELDPEAFVLGIDETIGVAAEAINVTKTLRQAAVTEQDGHLVQAFG